MCQVDPNFLKYKIGQISIKHKIKNSRTYCTQNWKFKDLLDNFKNPCTYDTKKLKAYKHIEHSTK